MRIRIRAGQKHADPADPDPKPWFLFKISWLVGLHLLSLFSFWRRHFPVYPHVRLLVAWFFCLTVSGSLSKFTKRNLQTSISPIGVLVFSCIYFIQKSIIKIKVTALCIILSSVHIYSCSIPPPFFTAKDLKDG